MRVESDAPDHADAVVRGLAAVLEERGANVRFETGARALGGNVVRIGVRDPEGRPQWLMPLRVSDAPERAARDVVAFLERWGFIPRAAARRAAA